MSMEIALERIQAARENQDQILDLSGLGLKNIPPEISELTHLKYLYLGNNQITGIDALEPLRQLQLLSLARNQLTEIPTFLLHLGLPVLWQNIVITSTLNMALLQAQVLAQSQDRALDRDIDRAKDRALDLARALDRARDLAHTRDLTRDLAHARDLARALDLTLDLTLSEDFYLAQKQAITLVQDLTLAQIRVQDLILFRALAQVLDQARVLSRAQDLNQARDLARDLARAITLALDNFLNSGIFQKPGIYLYNNPLEAPPPEIIQQGNDAIKTFLEDFVEKASLNEVKAILVGEGASGKTSLVKKLLHSGFDKKEPQTHGIKISKQEFEQQGQHFFVNFWDFGGQEIMHATHQFFLTKRCLYILVLDSRKDEKAEYWLNYIQSFGGEAPVIIILNKIDENPSFDVNRKFLSKKYPNIKAYYRVSCLNNEGIDTLKKDMEGYLWNLELRKTALPKSWFKVKQYMESMDVDYIGYSQFQSICIENHVQNAASQKILVELLNDLGVVLNYESLRLYDTQVLNPLWLTNAVYRIINSPILAESKGKFSIHDLDAIINDPRYQKENPEHWTNIFSFWKPDQRLLQFPEDKFLFIVAMMKQFELLFQIDEYHYLIPGLLAEGEDSFKFNETDSTLQFVIEYVDFLPASIIPRLMVKLNKYIHNKQAWKTGMVLEEKLLFNSIANIILDKENKKIDIEIKGKRNRDFLTVIRETIKEINSSYQNLDVIEWIPLPELYKGEQLLVDYIELLGYEETKQEQYFSGKLRKAFPVLDLLNGIEKPETRKASAPCHIFISYSHEDQNYKETLSKHLMPLVRLNKATLWDDTCIDAGEEWWDIIFENLNKADIVLCLISSGFIASEFCYKQELAQALEAHKKGSKKVIPVRIKEVNWDELDIAKIQGLPNKWMTEITDDKGWTEISKGIEAAIGEIKQQK